MPTIITGPVRLPDGTIPAHGRIIFTRKVPRIDSPLVVPGPVEAMIDPDGDFSVTLDGEAEGTPYTVTVEYFDDIRYGLKSVSLPDAVPGLGVAGPVPLSAVSALRVPVRDAYVLHKGDSATLPVTMLDANDRPADISDTAVTAWLELNGVRTNIGAIKSDQKNGLVELTITPAVSAGLVIGEYRLVIRLTVGSRVITQRGKIKII